MERDRARLTTHVAGFGEDALVVALWGRGIRVFARTGGEATLSDTDLLRGLVTSSEARFQLAVIPLLLGQPTCDAAVMDVLDALSMSQRETLTYYYQAATYLQVLERAHLTADRPLRDYFSTQLSLPVASHLSNQPLQLERALQDTARLQARATGLDLNWVGAYKTAARFALRKTRQAASPDQARISH